MNDDNWDWLFDFVKSMFFFWLLFVLIVGGLGVVVIVWLSLSHPTTIP